MPHPISLSKIGCCIQFALKLESASKKIGRCIQFVFLRKKLEKIGRNTRLYVSSHLLLHSKTLKTLKSWLLTQHQFQTASERSLRAIEFSLLSFEGKSVKADFSAPPSERKTHPNQFSTFQFWHNIFGQQGIFPNSNEGFFIIIIFLFINVN